MQALPQCNCTDTAGIAALWKRWVRAFELFAVGKGVTNDDQKKALFLHSAGMPVQDIYFTLPEEDGDGNFDKTVKTLFYFKPQANVPYERHVFRNMSQLRVYPGFFSGGV